VLVLSVLLRDEIVIALVCPPEEAISSELPTSEEPKLSLATGALSELLGVIGGMEVMLPVDISMGLLP
jgi:hypothetical protein